MSVIAIYSGIFCMGEQVVRDLASDMEYRVISDDEIVEEASKLSGLDVSKIKRAFTTKTSVFNKFTHEKESSIAHLRLALAEIFCDDNFIIHGFGALLIPKEISHVLTVCLIAEMKFRLEVAAKERGLSEKEAGKVIRKEDENCVEWTNTLFKQDDPWDPELYDIMVPVHKASVEDTVALIKKNSEKTVLEPTETSKKACDDFKIASRAEAALSKEGHNVEVTSNAGSVTLTVNKHVLMLGRLQEELRSIVEGVNGVKSVETTVGKDFHRSDIYRKHDFESPSKVLLVDDEREFVQTLSERLMLRDMGSAVAYDGESALNLIKEDEPEVMLLDLKMPGIDGLEVLRKVKETRPEIEVIILTGHGSDTDKEMCMKLGAFAYLQKPLDIDLLSDTIRKANDKIHLNRAGRDDSCVKLDSDE